jgi:hypothetical protein
MAKAKDPTNEGSPSDDAGRGATPPHHPLIEKMLAHEAQPQNAVELRGYFGPSPKPGFVRLYFQLDFRSYVEIPEGSIIDHAPVDPSVETGPTRVFVAGSTQLELVRVLEASFLQGSIASAHPVGQPLISTGQPTSGLICFGTTFTCVHGEVQIGTTFTCVHGEVKVRALPTHTTAHETR